MKTSDAMTSSCFIPALLVGLAINEDKTPGNGKRSKESDVTGMRIADFACGTEDQMTTATPKDNLPLTMLDEGFFMDEPEPENNYEVTQTLKSTWNPISCAGPDV